MIELAIIAAVLGGGAVALKLLTSKDGDRAGDELWTMAARRIDGLVELVPSSFFKPADRKIRLTVHGVALCVEVVADNDAQSTARYTQVSTVGLSIPYGARMQVQPRNILRLLSKRLGIGELPTGDAEFDKACHVSGEPRALVLAFLDAPTRRLLREARTGFAMDDALLVVRREGEPAEVGPLVDLARFAIDLVDRWWELMRGPQRLAESLDLAFNGAALRDLSNGRVASGVHRTRPITLSVRLDGDRALSVLSFDHPGMHEWTMERDENDAFGCSGEPPEAARAFGSIAPACLLGLRCAAQRIELAFDGLTPDQEDVAASLDSVMDALSPLAPYR